MKVVAVVPIKLNSERVKNKNIRPFTNGQPLCHYILETLTKVNGIDEIYVYCSNPAIKQYLPEGIKFLKRSENLDQSTTKINEVLISFAKDVDADYYLLTHATAPFIKDTSIQTALYKVLEDEYDSAFAVTKLQDFLWDDKKPLNYDLNSIPRTQDIEPIFEETSGLYIYNKDTIVNKNRRIGDKPYMIELSKIEAIDIDEEEDFTIADAVFNYCYRKGNE